MNQFFKAVLIVVIAFLSTNVFAQTVISNGKIVVTDKSWEDETYTLTGGISFTLTEDNKSPIYVECPFEAMKIAPEKDIKCEGGKYKLSMILARGENNGTAMHVIVYPDKFATFPSGNFRTNNFDDTNHFKKPVKKTYQRHIRG